MTTKRTEEGYIEQEAQRRFMAAPKAAVNTKPKAPFRDCAGNAARDAEERYGERRYFSGLACRAPLASTAVAWFRRTGSFSSSPMTCRSGSINEGTCDMVHLPGVVGEMKGRRQYRIRSIGDRIIDMLLYPCALRAAGSVH
jgi:hypothetical protein